MYRQQLVCPGVSCRALALVLVPSLALVIGGGGVDPAQAAPPMATAATSSGPPGMVPARGAAEPDLLVERPWVLAVHLALAAPAGSLAAEVERNLTRRLSAAVGAGIALGGRQYAGMLRLRWPWSMGRTVGIGAGASFGDYDQLSLYGIPEQRREDVLWGNAEAFFDRRTSGGFYIRLYAGYSVILDGGTLHADELASEELPSHLPYVGVAGGVCF